MFGTKMLCEGMIVRFGGGWARFRVVSVRDGGFDVKPAHWWDYVLAAAWAAWRRLRKAVVTEDGR